MTDIEKLAEEYVQIIQSDQYCVRSEEAKIIAGLVVRAAFLAGAEAAKPKWISVKERKPEPYQVVLCYGEPMRGGWAWSLNIYMGNGIWRVSDEGKENKSHITHWCPLPEPPEDK